MDETNHIVSQAQIDQLRVRQEQHNPQLDASLHAATHHLRRGHHALVHALDARGCVHGSDCLSKRGHH